MLKKNKWKKQALEEIIYDFEVGSLPPISHQIKGSTPIIKHSDIINRKFHRPYIYECKTFLNDKNIKTKRIVNHNDVIISTSGSFNIVGKAFIYLGKEKPILGPNLALLILKTDIDPKYLMHALNAPNTHKQINLAARTNGTQWNNLSSITFNNIRNITISVPPLEDQKRIARDLDLLLTSCIKEIDYLDKMLEIRRKQNNILKEKILSSGIVENNED